MPATPPPITSTLCVACTRRGRRDVSNSVRGLAAHPDGLSPGSQVQTDVAADAGKDRFRAALPEVAHVVGIGVKRTGERDVLEAFPRHRSVGEYRVVEPLGNADRHPVVERPADRRPLGDEAPLRRLGGLEHLPHRLVDGTRDVDQVDPRIGQHARELRRLLDLQAAFHVFRRRNPVANGVFRPDGGADRRQHPERETRPVLERAAIVVASLVGERREELAEQVAVGAVNENHVDAGAETALGGAHEVADDAIDVLLCHFARDRAGIEEPAGHGRRADRLAAVGDGRRLSSAMVELHGQLAAVLVDRLGDTRQARDHMVAVTSDLERIAASLGRDVARFELNQRCAAPRAFTGVVDVALVESAVGIGERFLHRTADEPVVHRHRVDLAGSKQVLKHRAGLPCPVPCGVPPPGGSVSPLRPGPGRTPGR